MVKIRLTRVGRKHRPLFTIVAADGRSPRDGKFLEKLGQYDPLCQTESLKNLNLEGMKRWMEQGAVCSDTVRSLLKKNNIQLS